MRHGHWAKEACKGVAIPGFSHVCGAANAERAPRVPGRIPGVAKWGAGPGAARLPCLGAAVHPGLGKREPPLQHVRWGKSLPRPARSACLAPRGGRWVGARRGPRDAAFPAGGRASLGRGARPLPGPSERFPGRARPPLRSSGLSSPGSALAGPGRAAGMRRAHFPREPRGRGWDAAISRGCYGPRHRARPGRPGVESLGPNARNARVSLRS